MLSGNPTNRIQEIAGHISWYGLHMQERLAQDSEVSSATIGRLVGEFSGAPSYAVVLKVTEALSARLGMRLDLREVFSLDGSYPTSCVCVLVGCNTCPE